MRAPVGIRSGIKASISNGLFVVEERSWMPLVCRWKPALNHRLGTSFSLDFQTSSEAMIGLRQDCIESSRTFEIEIKDTARKISSKQNKAKAQDQEKIAPSAHHVETQIKIT